MPLTADLPAVAAGRTPEPRPGLAASPAVREKLAGFLSANLICWVIWLATGADSSIWPKWVTLGTALALAVAFIHDRFDTDFHAERASHRPAKTRLVRFAQ